MAFNGLLQGVMQGIAAGATGGAEVAKGYYEDQRKVDVYKEMADIETEKRKLIEKFRSDLDVERKGKELELERKEEITRGKNPEYLESLRARDIAGVAGDIKLKQTRSADSIATEGPSGGLKGTAKAEYDLLAKSIVAIDTAITKAQADNTWNPNSDNAKTLMDRRAKLASQAMAVLKGSSTGSATGKSAADFYTSTPETESAPPTSARTSTGPSAAAAPGMDVSTRRAYTTQGKEGAIASLQAKIKQYEDALIANPDEGLDYSKQIQGLKDQISAVQRMK